MRKSAIVWLIPGILFGLITLGGLGAGGYWIHLTHTKVQEVSDNLDKKKQEIARLKASKLAPDQAKAFALEDQTNRDVDVELPNAERDRLIAIILTSTVVIPGLLALVFLVMGVMRFMQKPKQPKSADEDADEDEEEAEEAEKPPVKKSVADKAKPADKEE